jgi:hypothetical protein
MLTRSHSTTLTVHKEDQEDVYHNRARIPEPFRGSIREGRVCKLSVGSASTLVEVRGAGDSDAVIKIGELARRALAVRAGESHKFCLREVWWIGQLRWAWSASDSASRIAARLGILGLLLGLIGLVLGIISLYR